jgi:hypothetical protein
MALKPESAPMNLPTGVRAPARMTASAISISFQKSVTGRQANQDDSLQKTKR